MANCTPQGANRLYGLIKQVRFDKGIVSQLPASYMKFYKEWKETKPTAVHHIPKEGKWERDEITGIVRPIQDIPLPVLYPPEHHQGIWGGEGVVQGYQKRTPTKRRVPHFWVPVLRRSIVYSSVLDKYMSVTVTDRTMDLIHESHGFDHYLLKTPACDLKSTLALTIKRHILQNLMDGCPNWSSKPEKQTAILDEYIKYTNQYTEEEIEWYGLSLKEAVHKLILQQQKQEELSKIPHKIEFRSKLVEQLKDAGLVISKTAEDNTSSSGTSTSAPHKDMERSSSWLSKMNPFGKKQET